MTCTRCALSLTPFVWNNIGYGFCLEPGGCRRGVRTTLEGPRDLFALMGVRV